MTRGNDARTFLVTSRLPQLPDAKPGDVIVHNPSGVEPISIVRALRGDAARIALAYCRGTRLEEDPDVDLRDGTAGTFFLH